MMTLMMQILTFSVLSSLWAYEPQVLSQPASYKPPQMQNVKIVEKLGTRLDLSLPVRTEAGEVRKLSEVLRPNRPTILSFVYFSCPALCNLHMNGVTEALKKIKWTVGQEFDVVALSFDSNEGSELAQKKKENYLRSYGRGDGSGWHFLTAEAATIQKLTQEAGFSFQWNEQAKEWAHASAAIVLTPQGKISRYVHGIAPEATTLRWSLAEATQGKIGSFVDQLMWVCMIYDPALSKYTLYAMPLVKAAGLFMILVLGFLLIPQYLKSRRQRMSV